MTVTSPSRFSWRPTIRQGGGARRTDQARRRIRAGPSGVPRLCAREPLRVLVTLATDVQDALPPQEGEVALHAGLHCAAAEVPELLSVLLTVEDSCAECRSVELACDGGKVLERERCNRNGAGGAVESERLRNEVDMVVLDAVVDELANDLRE